MKLQNYLSVVAVLLVLAPAASAQKSVPKAGQTIYVVAVKSSKQPDLSIERKIKDEFEKHKSFKITKSLQSADLVFLAVVEYEFNQVMINNIGAGIEDVKSVAAFVVLPDEYAQSKNDLDNMREKALWQTNQNNNARRTANMPRKIVDKFHEDTAPKKL
jgi:Skp family chaperone for outer membrane proteins